MNFKDYSPEELLAVSRRAGVASGAVRRAKRDTINQMKLAEIARRELAHEEVLSICREAKLLLRLKKALNAAQKAKEYT